MTGPEGNTEIRGKQNSPFPIRDQPLNDFFYVAKQNKSKCVIKMRWNSGDSITPTSTARSDPVQKRLTGTFRSEDDGDYEFEFSVLSMRTSKNVGLQTLCAFSVLTTPTRSRPRSPI